MLLKRIFISVLVSAFIASPALAEITGLYFTEGLIGYSLKFNIAPTSVTERTMASSETGLGYIIAGWLYFGGIFNYTMVNEKTSDNGNNLTSHQETYQYYGPSLGWMGDEWSIIGHYFAYAEMRDNVTPPAGDPYTTNRTGSGYGVSLGYRFMLGSFELGPTISYKAITYTNCKDSSSGATSTCNPAVVQNEITPYITLLFNFK